jgi:transposase
MFEAILWKLRTAARWSDLEVSGNHWSAVRRRAESWRTSGAWEAAMEALKDSGGVPVPPLMVLPPMEVWGSIDPRFAAGNLRADRMTKPPAPRRVPGARDVQGWVSRCRARP